MQTITLSLFLLGFNWGLVRSESCAEHFTCLSPDRTTDYLQFLKLNSSVPNWYELCNCDNTCHIFGDCCADAPVLNQIRLEEWTFVKIRLNSKLNYMSLMKNKCPSQWKNKPNSDIKNKCEQSPLSSMYDYFLPDVEHLLLFGTEDEFNNWHVTSRQTMTTYRNLYCSICNEDTQVDAWSQRLRCSSGSEATDAQKCTSVFYQTTADILRNEKLRRATLQNKVHSSCNFGWYKMSVAKQRELTLETTKKCVLFYEPVVVRDPKSKKFILFKNKYCAKCNDFEESTHLCPSESVDQSTQMPASFTVLTSFDTKYEQGSLMGETNQTCASGQVYNPLISACQEVNRRPEPSRPKEAPSQPGSSLGHKTQPTSSSQQWQISSMFMWLAVSLSVSVERIIYYL